MGRISRALVEEFQQHQEVLGRLAGQFTDGLPDDVRTYEQLVQEGYDSLHALYVSAQNFVSLFAEQVSELPEFEAYCDAVEKAEDEYMPGGPPMSPLTNSYFTTWAFFDLPFGPDRETMGTCLLDLMRTMEADPLMIDVLESFQASRMGIYEHCGSHGRHVRLRELITGDDFVCHSTSGYRGRKGELWYARVCPPVAGVVDYHVVVTTPYVLTESSVADWTAYLNKALLNTGSDKRQGLGELLKYGRSRCEWHEFIFLAYHHHQFDAIFLAGLPDVPESLPHGELKRPSDEAVLSARAATSPTTPHADEEPGNLVRVKFTEVQRKAIASFSPELQGRLKLDLKNQRTIELTAEELDRVEERARAALGEATRRQSLPLRKIVQNLESQRKRASARTVYQLRIDMKDTKPPIWRRIQIEDCTLEQLHFHIQAAMGWMDSHLYEFQIEGARYSSPPPMDFGFGGFDDFDAEKASGTRLSEVLPAGTGKFRFHYLYDFGDSWEHVIQVEQVKPSDLGVRYPQCVDGRRACPPEDCGGVWGFYEFVQAVTHPDHEEHEEMLEWHGPYDPNAFDAKDATRQMRRWADSRRKNR